MENAMASPRDGTLTSILKRVARARPWACSVSTTESKLNDQANKKNAERKGIEGLTGRLGEGWEKTDLAMQMTSAGAMMRSRRRARREAAEERTRRRGQIRRRRGGEMESKFTRGFSSSSHWAGRRHERGDRE